jgi:hypothetical protein
MLVLAVAVMTMTGCASKHMDVVTIKQNEGVLAKNQAAIVFFRDTVFGGAIQAPVVESLDKDVAFVGIVSANTKLLHKTTPGQHIYVVGGEGSNMLEADLAPQKFYYVRVTPKMGFWKARFAFESIAADDVKLQKALSGCTWVTAGATSQAWFNDNKSDLQSKSDDAAEKESRAILRPENGLDMLIQ